MAAPDTHKARHFLEQLNHVTVAVIDNEGKPWAVPVGVSWYASGVVEWFSKTTTVHSHAIARNPEVMLSAFTTDEDEFGQYGFFARARARKVLPLPGVGKYRAEIYEAWYTDASRKKIKINIQDL